MGVRDVIELCQRVLCYPDCPPGILSPQLNNCIDSYLMPAHVDKSEKPRGAAADLRGGGGGCHSPVVEHFTTEGVTQDL